MLRVFGAKSDVGHADKIDTSPDAKTVNAGDDWNPAVVDVQEGLLEFFYFVVDGHCHSGGI
jgi:hypothetical protein